MGQLLHIGKSSADALFGVPQSQAAHARHVDDVAAAGQVDDLARNRGVPALAIAAHLGGFLHLASHQHVHQARLAHAASADEHRRLVAFGNGLRQALHRFGAAVGHGQKLVVAHETIDAAAYFLNLFGRGHQVGLGKHHHNLGARFMRQHQLALQPADVHLFDGLRHHHQIEVGGKRLGQGALGRVLAHEAGAARKRFLDDSLVVPFRQGNAHTVAHHSALVAALHQRNGMLAAHLFTAFQAHQGVAPIELDHLPFLHGIPHHSVPSRFLWYTYRRAAPAMTASTPATKICMFTWGYSASPEARAASSSTWMSDMP